MLSIISDVFLLLEAHSFSFVSSRSSNGSSEWERELMMLISRAQLKKPFGICFVSSMEVVYFVMNYARGLCFEKILSRRAWVTRIIEEAIKNFQPVSRVLTHRLLYRFYLCQSLKKKRKLFFESFMQRTTLPREKKTFFFNDLGKTWQRCASKKQWLFFVLIGHLRIWRTESNIYLSMIMRSHVLYKKQNKEPTRII